MILYKSYKIDNDIMFDMLSCIVFFADMGVKESFFMKLIVYEYLSICICVIIPINNLETNVNVFDKLSPHTMIFTKKSKQYH